MFFWTRKMNFSQPRWICFSRRQKRYTQSPRKKKIYLQRNNFPQSVSFCVRKKKLQVCRRIFGNYFLEKYKKTKFLWIFHFSIRMMFSTCKKLIWQPLLVFSTKRLVNFRSKYENDETFREIGKKTLFPEKISSGQSRLCLDNRAEFVLA